MVATVVYGVCFGFGDNILRVGGMLMLLPSSNLREVRSGAERDVDRSKLINRILAPHVFKMCYWIGEKVSAHSGSYNIQKPFIITN